MNNFTSEKYYMVKRSDGAFAPSDNLRTESYLTAFRILCERGINQFRLKEVYGTEPTTFYIEEHTISEYDDDCGAHHRNEMVQKVWG